MLDAFVCIGSVRTADGGVKEHVWVLTRELVQPQPGHADPQQQQQQQQRRIIRMWETTNAQIYTLDASGKQRFDEHKNLEGEFVLPEVGETADDVEGTEEEEEMSRSRLQSIEHNEPEEDIHDIVVDSNSNSRSQDTPDHHHHHHHHQQATAVDDNFSVFQEQREARASFAMACSVEQQERMEPLRVHEFNDSQSTPPMPFVSIDVVFNHQALFGNLQCADPNLITYNFFSEPNRWYRFPFERREKRKEAFYRKKPLRSTAPNADVRATAAAITRIVKVAIAQHREFNGANDADETTFFSASRFPSIDERLQIEEKFGGDREKRNSYLYAWRESLKRQLPNGFCLSEQLFTFKHSDAGRISDAVIRACGERLLTLRNAQTPHYVVRCRIQRLPCHVCPVRLFVACIYRPM